MLLSPPHVFFVTIIKFCVRDIIYLRCCYLCNVPYILIIIHVFVFVFIFVYIFFLLLLIIDVLHVIFCCCYQHLLLV
ncbi:uncharacterized protein BX663DRAFT_491465 [Cokeromyces recurvatus]|uniref:uncharacterized protein n=1 Tax=Cokeromyces recurvatus TaxID=90255 RepID=UPI0022204806|nr:uncharacterized protein BX663DRAFT_491465 [Cokeromyces recurvatus]KAI7907619.1 hypothetical protein BX663DRAFT_491465 [Cokeromyces recurvatus]